MEDQPAARVDVDTRAYLISAPARFAGPGGERVVLIGDGEAGRVSITPQPDGNGSAAAVRHSGFSTPFQPLATSRELRSVPVSEVACTDVRSPLPHPGIADLVTCLAYRRPQAVLRVSISRPW